MSHITKCGHPLRVQNCSACDGLGLPPAPVADSYSTWVQYPANLPKKWCLNDGMLFDGSFGDVDDVFYCSYKKRGNVAASCAELPQLEGYEPWKKNTGICIADDGHGGQTFGGTIKALDDYGECCAVPAVKNKNKHSGASKHHKQHTPAMGIWKPGEEECYKKGGNFFYGRCKCNYGQGDYRDC